jgi:hypothetical protein
MRLGMSVHLWGPFYMSDTLWRSKPRHRGRTYHGTLGDWKCPHNHTREDLAVECARQEARRRRMQPRR